MGTMWKNDPCFEKVYSNNEFRCVILIPKAPQGHFDVD